MTQSHSSRDPHSTIETLTDSTFAERLRPNGSPSGTVLVEFGATWCGPCKALAVVLERFAIEFAGRVDVATVDIDDSPETSTRYGVRGAPTLVVFRHGVEVGRHVGLTNKERMTELCGFTDEAR